MIFSLSIKHATYNTSAKHKLACVFVLVLFTLFKFVMNTKNLSTTVNNISNKYLHGAINQNTGRIHVVTSILRLVYFIS